MAWMAQPNIAKTGKARGWQSYTLDDLREADGVIFGSPTRYGNMTAQMKQLIDSKHASNSSSNRMRRPNWIAFMALETTRKFGHSDKG